MNCASLAGAFLSGCKYTFLFPLRATFSPPFFELFYYTLAINGLRNAFPALQCRLGATEPMGRRSPWAKNGGNLYKKKFQTIPKRTVKSRYGLFGAE